MTIPAALPITSLYAGVLGVAFALTSLRVGLTRAGTGKDYGAEGGSDLEHKVRSAGTIGEFGFPGLILLGLLEYQSIVSPGFLWLAGLVFTVARLAHSFQLASPQSVPKVLRMYGFLVTVAFLALAATLLLFGSAKN